MALWCFLLLEAESKIRVILSALIWIKNIRLLNLDMIFREKNGI